MEIRFGLGERRRRRADARHGDGTATTGDPARTAAQLVDSVMSGEATDLELIIQAARLVVSTRFASTTLLVRRLHLSVPEANRILRRLEHCEVIAPAEGSKPHSVLTTSQQLPGVIEEFIARG